MSKHFIISYDLHGVKKGASDHENVDLIISQLSSLQHIELVEELDVSTTWHIRTDKTCTRKKLHNAIIKGIRLFKNKGRLTLVSVTLLVASVAEFCVAESEL